jgi:ribosomal protein S27E
MIKKTKRRKNKIMLQWKDIKCPRCGKKGFIRVDYSKDILECKGCGKIFIKSFDKFLIDKMKRFAIEELFSSKEEYKNWLKNLTCGKRIGSGRRRYITGWYNKKDVVRYWKAIGERDYKTLGKMCKCRKKDGVVVGRKCPACEILRLREENKI